VTPYLIVRNCSRALEFYQQAFGATISQRFEGPEGKIMHAEIRIACAAVMLADEFPEKGAVSPQTLGGTASVILLYVPDVDAAFTRALAAGAQALLEVEDQFYGDRAGTLVDPFGHRWTLATHLEDVKPEDIERRFRAAKPAVA
jgi:PhnB protein